MIDRLKHQQGRCRSAAPGTWTALAAGLVLSIAGHGAAADAPPAAPAPASTPAPAAAPAPAPSPTSLLNSAANALNRPVDPAHSRELHNRANRAAWLLLVGELAADPDVMAFSGAVDALDGGITELDAVLKEIAADPEAERLLSTRYPAIAMRLDAARLRRDRAEEKGKLAREQERERLTQLRELIRSYRDVANSLAISNAYNLVGDAEASRTAYEDASKKLDALEAVFGKRRDFYLLSDEPMLEGGAATERPLLTAVPQPFSAEMKPHVAALQALSAYRLAVSNPAAPDPTLLEAALKLAEASGSSEGKKNAVALYVTAAAHRQLGLLATAKSPVSAAAHQQAKPHFDKARAALEEFRAQASAKPEAARGLVPEATAWTAELASPEVFLAHAKELTGKGRPVDALAELGRGLGQHRAAGLVLARTDAVRRAEGDLDAARRELDQAVQERLIKADDPAVVLVSAQLEIARVWRQANGSLEKLDAAQRGTLAKKLDALHKELDRAAAAAADRGELRDALRAHASLALALHAMVNPAAAANRPAEETALKQAADAAMGLADPKSLDPITARESVVAGRLAQGYLAVRVLPSYRDDATNAFAAAADEQARLPFPSAGLKTFGSPLVSALLSRPEGQPARLAQQERELRRVVTQFLDGAFAQSFGNPAAAAEQMATAITRARAESAATSDTEASPADAGKMLSLGDTIDARRATLKSLHAYTVLGFVRAGRMGRAVAEAVLTGQGEMPEVAAGTAGDALALAAVGPAQIERALNTADDPLAAYALAAALEGHADQLTDPAETARWFELARRAHLRARQLFDDSPAQRARFAEPSQANARALARLSSPDTDVAEARALRHKSQPEAAAALLRQTLRRHPAAPAVRVELAGAMRDLVDLTLAPEASLREALALLPPPSADGLPAVELLRGELLERLGEPAGALRAYQSALARASTPEERLFVSSRVAVLSARVADQ